MNNKRKMKKKRECKPTYDKKWNYDSSGIFFTSTFCRSLLKVYAMVKREKCGMISLIDGI
jgi:hypothetical protein